jgi:starch synthase
MYAHRYGTVPIVRSVGGLRDTVTDIGETNGNGIKFNHFSVEDAMIALHRATIVYRHDESMKILRRRVMALDRSWETSANTYINMYKRLNWTV